MSYTMDFAEFGVLEKLIDLSGHFLAAIIGHGCGFVSLAITKQVWSNHSIAEQGKIADLMTPVIAA
jgi:hypothetical protein